MKNIVQVRTNMRFDLNYQTHELEPSVEIIILTIKPEYELAKDNSVKKKMALDEARFEVRADALNDLIGQLKAQANSLTQFAQIGGAVNGLIKSMKENKDKV